MASSKSGKNDRVNQTLEVIDPVYQKYAKSVIRALSSTDFYEYFMESVARADNEFQFSNRRMEKIVDTSWVDAIEDAMEGFQNIISSPRNVIKEEELIVNVANAKRTGNEVVRHLSQHASLVEDFKTNTTALSFDSATGMITGTIPADVKYYYISVTFTTAEGKNLEVSSTFVQVK